MEQNEAPNPLTPVLEDIIAKGLPVLHDLRDYSMILYNSGAVTKDVTGDLDSVEVLESLEKDNPDLLRRMEELYDMYMNKEMKVLPGKQPRLDNFVGGFVIAGDKRSPIVNVGSGGNISENAVNFDKFHYTESVVDYRESRNGQTISSKSYTSIKNDEDVPKCSRGVLQLLRPDELPDGDQVHIVPNPSVWEDNGLIERVGGNVYNVKDFQSAGCAVGGKEYDHTDWASIFTCVGWHMLLYKFVGRCVDLVFDADVLVEQKYKNLNQLCRVGRNHEIAEMSVWSEKKDGVLKHLVIRDGVGYLIERGAKKCKKFFVNTKVCATLMLESVYELEGEVFYLLGGEWNLIKLQQEPGFTQKFLESVKLVVDGNIVRSKDFLKWDDTMEGLIGYKIGDWFSYYYKSKRTVTCDVNRAMYRDLPKNLKDYGLNVVEGNEYHKFKDSLQIQQVRFVEEELDVQGKDGSGEKIKTLSFEMKIDCERKDKSIPDTIDKVVLLLKQVRAEDIVKEW